MALRSPVPTHNYWGVFASNTDLPNLATAPTQSANLEPGDIAYATGTQALYVCIDATLGAAVWSAVSTPSNSPAVDLFGRLRVANPYTLFDAKSVVDTQPLYFTEAQTGGAPAGAFIAADACVRLAVSASQTSVRQSREYFNYQPGKSQLVFQTFNLNGIEANVTKRVGYFDAGNGFFLELGAGLASFVRRSTSSVPTLAVPQASWNLDPMNGSGPSGITLDFTATQILVIGFEWLGVGSAYMGFVINGEIIYAHRFDNANLNPAVYMTTPNLPLRWEIDAGAGLVGSTHIDAICGTVITEGGYQTLGTLYGYTMPAPTGNIANGVSTTLFSFRHDPAYPRVELIPATVDPVAIGNGVSTWHIVWNPAFTVAPTWAAATRGYGQLDIVGQVTAGTGTILASGVLTNRVGATNLSLLDTTLTVGADVAGVSDVLSLVVTNLSGGNERYIAAFDWNAIT